MQVVNLLTGIIGVAGCYDHLDKPFLYGAIQRTWPSAALAAFHNAMACQDQWFWNDARLFVLVDIIFFGLPFGTTPFMHNLFVKKNCKLIIQRQR